MLRHRVIYTRETRPRVTRFQSNTLLALLICLLALDSLQDNPDFQYHLTRSTVGDHKWNGEPRHYP